MKPVLVIKTGGSDWSAIPRWTRFWYRVSNYLGYLQQLIFLRVIKEPVWRSSDGTVKLISQLDNSHLINIERMLTRRNNSSEEGTYSLISLELHRRVAQGLIGAEELEIPRSNIPRWAR